MATIENYSWCGYICSFCCAWAFSSICLVASAAPWLALGRDPLVVVERFGGGAQSWVGSGGARCGSVVVDRAAQ